MKHLPLVVVGCLSATTITSTTALSAASAAPAPPKAVWSTVAPDLYEVGGDLVSSKGTVATDDPTPLVKVDSGERGHAGGRLSVRDGATDVELCTELTPVHSDDYYHFAECTLSGLKPGLTEARATFISPDGQRTNSSWVDIQLVPESLEIEVVGYDRGRDVVSLSGTGPAGATVDVGQGLSPIGEGDFDDVRVGESGRWEAKYEHPRDEALEVGYRHDDGQYWHAEAAFSLKGTAKPIAARFEFSWARLAALSGTTATVEVRGAHTATVTARDASSGAVVQGQIGSDNLAHLDVEVPRGEVRDFEISGEFQDEAATPQTLTVRNDVTSLEAPRLTNITAPARDVMVVTGETLVGSELTVKDARGAVVGSAVAHSNKTSVRVKWNTDDLPSQRRFTLTSSYNGVVSAATPFRQGDFTDLADGRLDKPELDRVDVAGGVVTIRTLAPTAPEGSVVQVTDFASKVVASAPVRDGRADLVLPEPSVETKYLLRVVGSAQSGSPTSGGLDVTVLAGVGQRVPDPVEVGAVRMSGNTVAATLQGTSGATARVADDAGRILAVGRIGSSGSAQLRILRPAVRSDVSYSVTQAIDAIESDPVAIDLTPAG